MISIYATCKNKAQANKIATALIKKKLVACANMFPISSIYLWKGKLTKDKEYALLLKTSKSFKIIEKEIKKLHSYKVPCIEKLNADFNKEYKNWMKKELK